MLSNNSVSFREVESTLSLCCAGALETMAAKTGIGMVKVYDNNLPADLSNCFPGNYDLLSIYPQVNEIPTIGKDY